MKLFQNLYKFLFYKATSFFFLIFFPFVSFLHFVPIFGVCVCLLQAAATDVNKPQTGGTRTDARNDEKLRQALKLTARRVDAYQKEFDLLLYSFSSARIFFKSAAVVAAPPAADPASYRRPRPQQHRLHLPPSKVHLIQCFPHSSSSGLWYFVSIFFLKLWSHLLYCGTAVSPHCCVRCHTVDHMANFVVSAHAVTESVPLCFFNWTSPTSLFHPGQLLLLFIVIMDYLIRLRGLFNYYSL